MADSVTPDYVLIGHVARDCLEASERAGGTVLYAGVAAARLGRRVGIVTAHAGDFAMPAELADVRIQAVASAHTTTFVHQVVDGARHLQLRESARSLALADIPRDWLHAPIVHMAPIAGEVSPALAAQCQSPLVVATAQGWLRQVVVGDVRPAPAALDAAPLDGLAALVVSLEDLGGDLAAAERLARRVPILVLTQGPAGCTLYARGTTAHVAAYPAREVDSTGAGDVFATAFFIRLSETSDPLASARFAAGVAALSIGGEGVTGIPDRQQVETILPGLGSCA